MASAEDSFEISLSIEGLTGQRLAASVEITAGLKEGDKVIATVDERIGSGTKVTLKTE